MQRDTEDITKLSSDEQLEKLTQLSAAADNNPDIDFWSLDMDLLGRWPSITLYMCLGFNP